MESPDSAAGQTFEQRTANLSKRIKSIFKEFAEKRKKEYQKVRFEFSSSDWATGHITSKTVVIRGDTYIFTKIKRTENGDWKKGPTINGINRSSWFSGDIDGGSVTWSTGGHGRADTKWIIYGKFSDSFIDSKVKEDVIAIKEILNNEKLPAD
jgi:hypothetical protein